MEATEAAELFQKCAKLKSPGPDVNTEMLRIVVKVGKLALAITPAGPYITATPRLRSDIRLYLPEYRERRKQLLSMKAKKLIHRYGESVQHVCTPLVAIRFSASERLVCSDLLSCHGGGGRRK
jgi:hypothetical protein